MLYSVAAPYFIHAAAVVSCSDVYAHYLLTLQVLFTLLFIMLLLLFHALFILLLFHAPLCCCLMLCSCCSSSFVLCSALLYSVALLFTYQCWVVYFLFRHAVDVVVS
jgi:hypothetical protein